MPTSYNLSVADRKELAIAAVQASALRLSGGSISTMDSRKIAEQYYDFMVQAVKGER